MFKKLVLISYNILKQTSNELKRQKKIIDTKIFIKYLLGNKVVKYFLNTKAKREILNRKLLRGKKIHFLSAKRCHKYKKPNRSHKSVNT
jgi:hypothetical protein